MSNQNLTESCKYLYETHLHTKEASACAQSMAEDLVHAYKAAGYTGIMVTDHFFRGNNCISKELPWEEWVDEYCKGYENAKKIGDEIGLQVFFGWEESYDGADFLVYGLDKEWMKQHPELREISIEEQYALVHNAGGMVIHAHPYREAWYIPEVRLYPDSVDGVEICNAGHYGKKLMENGRSLYDAQATEYATKYDFPCTGGSDCHSVNLPYGGMAFDRPLEDVQDYIKAVLNREGTPIDYFVIRKQKELESTEE